LANLVKNQHQKNYGKYNNSFSRTSAQREITRQANSFWKRHCRPSYQTNIPLAESLEEFAKIDFKVRSAPKH
jgi:hypothetical protein